MKKLILLLLVLTSFVAVAENTVILKFNHLLDGKKFVADYMASAPDGKSLFKCSMLRYYISGIKITHDGGKVTEAKGKYILVNVANTSPTMGDNTKFELGSFDVNSIEAVEFSLGVDSNTNHLDPATYPSSSPLAPQQPTMHWGWNAGYRFVTFEGRARTISDTATYEFQIHSLGDEIYTPVKVNVKSRLESDGIISVTLNAEYKNLIKDIDVSTGMVEHGTEGIPAQMMSNFGKNVFSEPVVNCIEESTDQIPMSIYPNPARNLVVVSMGENIDADVVITNILGENVINTSMTDGNISLPIDLPSGMYGVMVVQNGKIVSRNTISVIR